MAGALTTSAALNATQGVSLGAVAATGGACSPNGKIATDASSALLVCRTGTWQSVGNGSTIGTNQITGLCGQLGSLLTNTSANHRLVYVNNGVYNSANTIAYVDGVAVAYGYGWNAGAGQPLVFLVPPESTYQVVINGSLSGCWAWTEWR